MARSRDTIPRLNFNPSMGMPQPAPGFQGQPMFSPAVQNYYPAFPMPNSLQTPMQPFFNPQPPPAPGRPIHHQGRASIAHLAAAGIHPPNGFPITPLAGHFARASMAGPIPGQPTFNPGHPPFPNRNRRQLSIGGPPKAVLGGPQRKLSPLPPSAPSPAPAPTPKVKKINVSLPKETVLSEDGQPTTRALWARDVLDGFVFDDKEIAPVQLSTAEAYPPDEYRHQMPPTLEVFLPGKRAWDEMKQLEIEQKLEKLGVERGFGSNVPHIHAPHARAASISSPADPQILLYKLNKLQQSQDGNGSGNNSLSASPNPAFGVLSSSPHGPRFMTNRHGHTMSLAHPPPQPFFDNGPNFDPFGPNLEVEPIPHSGPSALQGGIFAPQGRVPVPIASLAPPVAASRPNSRPDFIVGFGLDIPEESEEDIENAEAEELAQRANGNDADDDEDNDKGQVIEYEVESSQNVDGTVTASQSRFHSRHVSKLSRVSGLSHVSRLSAALSTQSVGALDDDMFVGEEDLFPPRGVEVPKVGQEEDFEDVGEWTGSEDIYVDETSDGEESIGEWSNPSDEERVRQARLDRRNRRRQSQQIDMPRRLPNFPRPPENTVALHMGREDDIISNPSEEGQSNIAAHGEYLGIDYYSRPPSSLNGASRPLPPLPHSRVASAQHTVYDPAHAHSRGPSDQSGYQNNQLVQQSFAPRRDSLNPFAKPFVFGAKHDSGSWTQGSTDVTPPKAPLLGHSRLPSLGKPLNVAAPEFKPGGFTFRPPPGVPIMPASLEISRSSPEVPVEESPFKVQGREKRQRRGSSSSVEEGDSMSSFRFPANLESPKSIRRTPATQTHQLNPSAEPFTFAGFSAVATLPYIPPEDDDEAAPAFEGGGHAIVPEETYNDESTAMADNGDTQNEIDEFKLPSSSKPKRAPIPLDFKHTVSNNTVPAGLFKALVNNNGDERTRRTTVRSRLSSREIFDYDRRPSMDDSDVAAIANKISTKPRSRLVTDPGSFRDSSPLDDIFGTGTNHSRRRSSFTDIIRPLGRRLSRSPQPPRDVDSGSEMSLTGRLEARQTESRLESIERMVTQGFEALRADIGRETAQQHSSTQSMISDIQSLIRVQLHDSAVRTLEGSQLDARGELDFQLVRDVVEDSHKVLVQTLRNDLHELQQQVWQARSNHDGSTEVIPAVERLGNRTVSAVIEAISELSARQEMINRSAPAWERDAIVENLMTVLTPIVASLRSEPIDYDFLTSELAQAVKPHISQLIDLASDKQETAGLIVDRLIPLLPSSKIDVDEITTQLTTEVRRAIAPIDAFEIKEQVADLVVERLDSRLAVRDKVFNIDTISNKVTAGVSQSLEPLQDITTSLGQLTTSQASLTTRQEQLSSAQDRFAILMSELPVKFSEGLQSLKSAQAEILAKLELPTVSVPEPDQNVLSIKATIQEISLGQKDIATQAEALRAFHDAILSKLNALPESLQAATDALKNNHNEFLTSHESSKREFDELRKANTDFQVQLSKARGAHGQIRVEKDTLSEKLSSAENDRDKLRSQFNDLQTLASEKDVQLATFESKNKELEDALAQALTRLQTSDVATQANQTRIVELETGSRELTAEKQALKHTVDSLDLQVTFITREKESALLDLETLRQQHGQLISQQSHWEELRLTSEKIDVLTHLIGQADNEELKELRRYRDRTKTLEVEHATLQKRFKDQETKSGNSERAATTARQSLAQAQQRSSEWERRAKESEGQLEMTKTQLEQAEQTQIQLEADYSLVKLQLEEQNANDRLAQDQHNKLREQISLLEAKCTRLQTELEKAVKPVPQPYRNITNGNTHPLPRPDSRASTVYHDRSQTPQVRANQSTAGNSTPPQPTVWDSIHAPPTQDAFNKYASTIQAPRGRYPDLGRSNSKIRRSQQTQPYRPIAPSPTPSTVSLAPTQGEDGWWS